MVSQRSFSKSWAHILSNDDAARINSLVNSVTVAKEPAFLGFDIIDQLRHILRLADVLDDFECGVDRPPMKRSVRSRDRGNGTTEWVSERRSDVQEGGGRVGQFVVCIEHPKLLEAFDVFRIWFFGLFFDKPHHTERVLDKRTVGIRRRERFLLHTTI